MKDFDRIGIAGLCVHRVGSKADEGSFVLSHRAAVLADDIKQVLCAYFTSSFKSDEYFGFYHDTDLRYNEVFGYVSEIFDAPDSLYEHSVNLAKHLYEKSDHPKIKSGEFYVVYFSGCVLDGETVDAVGLFKSENRDTFLQVYPSGDGFEIVCRQGIHVDRLDKGALIFNTGREEGYAVAVADNTNRGAEARYWLDDFLHVRQREDAYYNTGQVLSLCKSFVTKELPQRFEVSRADQADLLNKSVRFFKEKDAFDMETFAAEVIGQPEVIDSFNQYRSDYERERDVVLADNFAISDSAVKRQARAFKSVIKLDKNFHIYVHGDRELIEQGEDGKGKFYKVYYNEES